jgi:3-dehydroquinate synthase
MSNEDTIVRVDAASASYDVHVTPGCLACVGELVRREAGGEVAFVVSDTNVAPLYLSDVTASLEAVGYRTGSFVFEAGEASKRAHTWAACLEAIAEAGLTRDDVVVALGGGVTGDLAGFAAASYMRGCSVAQVPTSLLAMVDSSVGGKTAIDLEAGKNLAGAFWQPKVVIADPHTLRTISHELLTDSCGEVIKHGVLADPELFAKLERSPINAPGFDENELARIIARNVEIKRDVVNADERERGLRQTLNLGHTVGHAVEAASNFELGHGTCVAIGLCFVMRACAKLGICPEEDARRVVACVAAHGLPTTTGLTTDELYAHALADKKRHGSHMNVVMVKRIGEVYVEKMPLERFREFIELGR